MLTRFRLKILLSRGLYIMPELGRRDGYVGVVFSGDVRRWTQADGTEEWEVNFYGRYADDDSLEQERGRRNASLEISGLDCEGGK
jgi:hypothetical protein